MYPASLPWTTTDSGAQVKLGQLGLLIVRKVKTDFTVVVLGRQLTNHSVTMTEAKERAEQAARRWVAEAGAILWTKDLQVKETPPRTTARPGGIGKKPTLPEA